MLVSSAYSMNCATENVVYLISCTRCGVQYVARNYIAVLITIETDGQPILLVRMDTLWIIYVLCKLLTLHKRLEREDYWCRELCTFYPYGLNDNVRGVGNISKMKGQGQLVVNTVFNRNKRKFRVRKYRRRRKKRDLGDLTDSIEHYLKLVISVST